MHHKEGSHSSTPQVRPLLSHLAQGWRCPLRPFLPLSLRWPLVSALKVLGKRCVYRNRDRGPPCQAKLGLPCTGDPGPGPPKIV